MAIYAVRLKGGGSIEVEADEIGNFSGRQNEVLLRANGVTVASFSYEHIIGIAEKSRLQPEETWGAALATAAVGP